MAHFALHIKPAKSTLQALVLDLSVAILGGGGAEWVGEQLTSLRDSNSCSYGGIKTGSKPGVLPHHAC